MNDFPNLDWNILKKAIRTYEGPAEPREPRRPPVVQRGGNEFEAVQSEMATLQEDLVDAREKQEIGRAKTLKIKIESLQDLLSDCVNSPEIQEMIANKAPEQQVMNALNKMLAKKREYQKTEMGVPLEDQLQQAIREERYEDAEKIQKELDRFKKLVGKRRILDTMTITADNLDLTEINKPYDEWEPVRVPRTHRFRFRNEPGGQDELFWEGMGGTMQKDRGIGSDQYEDVGSPASISLSTKKMPLKKPNPFEDRRETGLPNEKMERDPQEEKTTTDVWRDFYDMQQR